MKEKYYKNIKEYLIDDEIYSKEKHRVITYYEIDKLLSEAGKSYGDKIIEEYSKKLVLEVGKKYTARTLRRMRQLYLFFTNQNWSTMGTKLSWSQYSELLI